MQIGDIEYEAIDRVATITLNRPEKFNAITEDMPLNLVEAVELATIRSPNRCQRWIVTIQR